MAYTKTLSFTRDALGWAAEVQGHTRAQNSMVLGADRLCEHLSAGHNHVTITIVCADSCQRH